MLSPEEYVKKKGAVCPQCNSWDIQGGSFDTSEGEASQEVSCNECGFSWIDWYILTGYERNA